MREMWVVDRWFKGKSFGCYEKRPYADEDVTAVVVLTKAEWDEIKPVIAQEKGKGNNNG